MYAFDYQRPASLAKAIAIFKSSEDASFMAGGQTLIPTLKQRLRQPSIVVDLGGIGELRSIAVGDDVVRIGAMTTHWDVASAGDIARILPVLPSLASGIGDPQVRHRGTIGGSIANNDPAADYPAAVLALNARIHTSDRIIAADDFFVGMFETAIEPGELITEVAFPVPKRAAYVKFRNPVSRYAVVGVLVAETADGIRVAVTGGGPGVFRLPDMEHALAESFSPAAIDGIAIPPDDLNGDIHASQAYRAHLIGVMAKRAVASIA